MGSQESKSYVTDSSLEQTASATVSTLKVTNSKVQSDSNLQEVHFKFKSSPQNEKSNVDIGLGMSKEESFGMLNMSQTESLVDLISNSDHGPGFKTDISVNLVKKKVKENVLFNEEMQSVKPNEGDVVITDVTDKVGLEKTFNVEMQSDSPNKTNSLAKSVKQSNIFHENSNSNTDLQVENMLSIAVNLVKQNENVKENVPFNEEMQSVESNESDVVITDFTNKNIEIQSDSPNKTNSLAKSLKRSHISYENSNLNTDLQVKNVLSTANVNFSDELSLPKNIKISSKSTKQSSESQSLEWPTNLATEYLSKVSLVLEQIKSNNVNMNDLQALQNTTSYLTCQVKGVEYNTYQNYEDNALMSQTDGVISKIDATYIASLLEKYRFLTVQTKTKFYCTLCNVFINDASRNNEYIEIHRHMDSAAHKEVDGGLEVECSVKKQNENSNVPITHNSLFQECQGHEDHLNMEGLDVKSMLCEEYLSFGGKIDYFENETHKSLCCAKQIENNLQENYKNAMEFIKTNMSFVKSKIPPTVTLFYICCICDFVTSKFEVWRNHLKAEYESNVGKHLKSHFCNSCKVVLFGEMTVWNEHCFLSAHVQLSMEGTSPKNPSHLVDTNDDTVKHSIIVPDNFEICNVSEDDIFLTHKIFLNKIEKHYSEKKGRPTKGFFCSLCNMFMFYEQNRVVHKDLHVQPGTKTIIKYKQLFCSGCSVDLYCDETIVEKIIKEHLLLRSHQLMAEAMGYDPNNPDLICRVSTDLTLPLDKGSDVLKSLREKADNLSVSTEHDKCDSEYEHSEVENNTCRNVSKKLVHETFIKEIFEHYCGKGRVIKEVEGAPRIGFYCDICIIYSFYGPEVKHHDKAHRNRKNSMYFDCKVFVCEICNIELYGRKNLLNKHKIIPSHKIIENEMQKRKNNVKSLGENVNSGNSTNKAYKNIPPKVISNLTEEICSTNVDADSLASNTTAQEFKAVNTESGNLVTCENSNINDEKPTNFTVSEKRPCNVIDHDQNHKTMMAGVAKYFLKTPRTKLPDVVAYLCEACIESTVDQDVWEQHTHANEHLEQIGNFALHICGVCRVTFLCSKDYFENHLKSYGHLAVETICEKKQKEVLELEEKRGDSQSESESSLSGDGMDEDEAEMSDNEETVNKISKKQTVKPKMKTLGLLVQGFPVNTKTKAFYKTFYNMGFHVQYVQMNYKKKSGTALVLLSDPADLEAILKNKEPLTIEGAAVTVSRCFSEKKDRSQKYQISTNLSKLFYSPAVLMGVVDRLILQYTMIAKEELIKTNHLLDDITHILHGARAYPFGSRLYGVTSGTSDLDVFVDIDDSYYDNSLSYENDKQEQNNIRYIANEVRRCSVFSNVIFIPARVPIVRFVHQPTGLACDISCKNGLSVENTILTKCYLESDPRVAWLVTAVKYWANINTLKDSSRFTSYALTWMVLYFLMQLKEPVVFPVESLRKLPHKRKAFITGWDCQFCTDVKLYTKTKNTQLVLELLHDFFVFYATLDHENYVLCPILGRAIHTDKFKKLDLPSCFKSYVYKFNVTREHILLKKPLCVQDPLDLGHNVTKNVKKDCLNYFKQLCIKSARLCEEW